MVIFQKRLKEKREERNLTQQQLGDGIFVSKQEVCLYEKGKRTPPIDVLIKIANFLEVDFLWLIGMEASITRGKNRIVNLSKDDVKIIEALKKDSALYAKFLENPDRTVVEISKSIIK